MYDTLETFEDRVLCPNRFAWRFCAAIKLLNANSVSASNSRGTNQVPLVEIVLHHDTNCASKLKSVGHKYKALDVQLVYSGFWRFLHYTVSVLISCQTVINFVLLPENLHSTACQGLQTACHSDRPLSDALNFDKKLEEGVGGGRGTAWLSVSANRR
jgi:hypothetical protein